LRRLIQPSEIACHVAYLASDAAQGITGQVIAVDAGFLVR
jgi:enoyl-[acyl-carrier-protein] reductase (NADH)